MKTLLLITLLLARLRHYDGTTWPERLCLNINTHQTHA